MRRQIRDFEPDAIVASDPYIGAAALIGRWLTRGRRPQVILEVHGDWRTFTRLYGSPQAKALLAARRLRQPRRPSAAATPSARCRGTRSALVEEVRGVPVDRLVPDLHRPLRVHGASDRPLPERPTALFVGMLEAYKNVDGLAAAWREVAARLPEARLVVVGKGARHAVDRRAGGRAAGAGRARPELLAGRASRRSSTTATVLVLPSRSEGLGRVVIEAFARGRGVVASARRRHPRPRPRRRRGAA